MIVVDTSVIVAFMNATDDDHAVVAEWLEHTADRLVTTPLILAEVDHLVNTSGGTVALQAFYDDLAAGAYLVEWCDTAAVQAVDVARRYDSMSLGLADASLVALADRHETIDLATLDERHFRAVRPLVGGAAFRLLPTDAGH